MLISCYSKSWTKIWWNLHKVSARSVFRYNFCSKTGNFGSLRLILGTGHVLLLPKMLCWPTRTPGVEVRTLREHDLRTAVGAQSRCLPLRKLKSHQERSSHEKVYTSTDIQQYLFFQEFSEPWALPYWTQTPRSVKLNVIELVGYVY